MKTAQPMSLGIPLHHPRLRGWRALGALPVLLGVLCVTLFACEITHRVQPTRRTSPYTAQSPVTWGVAPLRNESGVSAVDELRLSDTLANEIQQVPGINGLPINRSIAALRALGLTSIATPEEARRLADALGADFIIVGTITAYDPYDPPVLGLNLALFAASNPRVSAKVPLDWDPLALRGQDSDTTLAPAEAGQDRPLAVAAAVLDAADGDVRVLIAQYARGRHEPKSALGWQRYIKSMRLYAKFACFELTQRLLRSEQSRLASLEAQSQTAAAR